MDFTKFKLTRQGLELQSRVQAGAKLVFTRAMITQGEIGGAEDTEALERGVPLALLGSAASGANQATLTLALRNDGMAEGMQVGGIAVWAEDPAVGEILYGIANSGAHPGWIPPFSECPVELIYDVTVAVSAGSEILIEDNQSRIFVSWNAMEERMATHGHTAGRVTESTGESVEDAQRRQDAAVEALAQAAGTNLFERAFTPDYKLSQWNIAEGVLRGGRLTTGGAA